MSVKINPEHKSTADRIVLDYLGETKFSHRLSNMIYAALVAATEKETLRHILGDNLDKATVMDGDRQKAKDLIFEIRAIGPWNAVSTDAIAQALADARAETAEAVQEPLLDAMRIYDERVEKLRARIAELEQEQETVE